MKNYPYLNMHLNIHKTCTVPVIVGLYFKRTESFYKFNWIGKGGTVDILFRGLNRINFGKFLIKATKVALPSLKG